LPKALFIEKDRGLRAIYAGRQGRKEDLQKFEKEGAEKLLEKSEVALANSTSGPFPDCSSESTRGV
jgi:hypothetical protein